MTQLSGAVLSLSGKAESATDSRFGPAPLAPALLTRLCADGCDRQLAFVLTHPSGNFLGHYLIEHLHKRGVACLALNTRYVGNDTFLLMERAIQDVGAGVTYLRDQGFKRIVLIGNSGGGALAAFYQAEADHLTINSLPDGRPFDIQPSDLPPVNAVALLAAHPSRASVLTDWLDPSVVDEGDIWRVDQSLNMFAPENGPPYASSWLARYRAAQAERNDRITELALSKLAAAEQSAKQSAIPVSDLPLVVHRTGADPRFLDLLIDADDRTVQNRQAAEASNYAANNMARMSSLRSWLSQWSIKLSRGDGPACIKRTTVPIFVVRYSADGIVYPSQIDRWNQAAGKRATSFVLQGARHFLRGQVELQGTLADLLVEWARALN
jgi:pimeloyl-ACP methyl ester carboxylesterase